MKNFAVLRIAKFKSLSGLSGASDHNMRMASKAICHADNHRTMIGGGVRLMAGCPDAVKAWKDRIHSVGLKQYRQDAVLAVEFVMSASPEWFLHASMQERADWIQKSLKFAEAKIGRGNILQATAHDDEETLHLHVLGVPLTAKERKKAGRPRKGRTPSQKPTERLWGLAAADLIGSPEKLSQLQTDYALELAELGIRRGRSRRVTGAQHQSAHAYRERAAEVAKGADYALHLGFDAIEKGQIKFDRNKQKLVLHQIDDPVIPKQSVQGWRQVVHPFFGILRKYAQKLSDLSYREELLSKREQENEARIRYADNLMLAAARAGDREAEHDLALARSAEKRRLRRQEQL